MRVILKNNSNTTTAGEGVINLPERIWKELDWNIHDILTLNIEKIRGTQDRRCCVIFATEVDEIEKLRTRSVLAEKGKKVYIEKGDA